jgi:beta-N-acetylhexosaminidase
MRRRAIWTLVFAIGSLLAAIEILDSSRESTPIDVSQQAHLRTMIGQMLIIGFPGSSMSEEWPARVAGLISDGEIGGVLLLSGNVQSPAQLRALTGALTKAGGPLKPFIAIDQEGGTVQRLTRYKGFLGLPAAGTVAMTDPAAAFTLYSRQARELAVEGITVNFGPVVDLNINPDNPIIAKLERSFGDRPEIVTPYARAFIKAHLDAGVLTAAKHFPGHGSSSTDPHRTVANISRSWTKDELAPFKSLAGDYWSVPMIMVGHLVLDGFSDGGAPTSLSHRAVTEILRNELGYKGLIVTDDLDMAAVRERYGAETAFVKAVAAGNDLIIAANNRVPDSTLVQKVTDAIVAAVGRGEIEFRRIEKSYERILAAKAKLAEMQALSNRGETRRDP